MFLQNRKNKTPPSPKKISEPNKKSNVNNQQQSLLTTLGQGIAWGTGTSLAKSIFTSNSENNQKKEELDKQKKCEEMHKYYNNCLQYNYINYDTCDFIRKDLKKICDNI
jgi:hypothetical protein